MPHFKSMRGGRKGIVSNQKKKQQLATTISCLIIHADKQRESRFHKPLTKGKTSGAAPHAPRYVCKIIDIVLDTLYCKNIY